MALNLPRTSDYLEISIDGIDTKPTTICYDRLRNPQRLPVYTQHDTILSGHVKLNPKKGSYKKQNIHIQLIGETETYHEKDTKDTFLLQSQELNSEDGAIFPFSFKDFELLYETYYSTTGRIRYYIKALLQRDGMPVERAEAEFAVQLPVLGLMYHNQGYEIQLRIADFLRVDVDLNRTNFHLDDLIIGKITVQQILLGIKRIQVALHKREIYNPTPAITCTKEDVIERKELISHCPKKGEIIPFKLGLSGLDITPNLLQSNPKLQPKYILVLSFIDEEDRSLFKPIELNIWRKKEI